MFTRRQFGKLALAALPAPLIAARIDSRIHGVQIGLHTFSFSGQPQQGILDVIVRAMADTGIGECILLARQIGPGETAASVRGKFETAGIDIYGYGASLNAQSSIEDLNRAFETARALGARIVTLGGTLSLARRLAPIAESHKMLVGLQGRPAASSRDPDQISRPEDYDEALKLSKNFRLSFDIGDATGAGFNALQFVQEHRERMDGVYLKDRRKDRTSVPWGEGDSPIRQVLQWIRDGHYPIRGFIDCDYKTEGDRAAEVKRCFAYAKAALA